MKGVENGIQKSLKEQRITHQHVILNLQQQRAKHNQKYRGDLGLAKNKKDQDYVVSLADRKKS